MNSAERSARRAERKATNEAHVARMAAIRAENVAVVATGKCPDCGAGLHRNTSLAGWWQCDRSGSGHFRRDQTGAHCDFQCFTE
jgi:hypothetical protein